MQPSDFTDKEKLDTQRALDLYPDASPFWDSSSGQEALECADVCDLRATTTNRQRITLYRDFCNEQLKRSRVCPVCLDSACETKSDQCGT